MNFTTKTAAAVLVAIAFTTPSQAGGRGHGGHGHSGRGPVGSGRSISHTSVRTFRAGSHRGIGYAARWHGRFSHRHWDGRFHRWLYFNASYGRWYCYSPEGSQWVVVNGDVPEVPTEETPAEVIPADGPPDDEAPPPAKTKAKTKTKPADEDD